MGCQKIGKNSIDNICPAVGDRLIQKHEEKFSFFGRKSEGKRGVGGGRGNVVNPIGFSIISMAGARGERGR